MQKFIEDKPKLSLLAGIGIVAGLGAYLLTSKKSNTNLTPIFQNVNFHGNFDQLINEVEKVREECKKTDNNKNFVEKIYQAHYHLSQEQVSKKIVRSRMVRRKLFEDKKLYQDQVLSLQKQIELIVETNLHIVLSRLKILKREWHDMRNFIDYESYEKTVKQKLALSMIEKKKNIGIQTINKIHKFSIDTLSNCKHLILAQQRDGEQKRKIFEAYLDDKILFQFKCEPQDLLYSLSILSQEQKQKIAQNAQLVDEIIQNLVYDYEDSDDDDDSDDE